jgi:predicted nucleotidyltransferase
MTDNYKDTVLQRLQEHWDYAVDCGYNEERFLGIFCYGSQNYGTANEDSDVDSRLIILPTFEELCLGTSATSECLDYKDTGEHINIMDINTLRNMFIKQNINFIEILFTEYFILNPRYKELWNVYFINNRELIAHYDKHKAFTSIIGQTLHLIDLENEDKFTDKDLYNAYRLNYFLQDYIADKPYSTCIRPEESAINFLKKIKAGKYFANREHMEASAKELYEVLIETKEKYEGSVASSIQERNEAAKALKDGTIEILKYSFDNTQNGISKEEFYKNLTNAETKAYQSIIRKIGWEGTVIISKLVEENKISRPVYNNLLIKMQRYGVAEITNMGVKGTYIEITDNALKEEAIYF